MTWVEMAKDGYVPGLGQKKMTLEQNDSWLHESGSKCHETVMTPDRNNPGTKMSKRGYDPGLKCPGSEMALCEM